MQLYPFWYRAIRSLYGQPGELTVGTVDITLFPQVAKEAFLYKKQ
jgi:hypothetical protein